MNLEDVYMKYQWCDELLKEIDEIKEAKYPDLYIDTGSTLNAALLVLENIKRDLKIKKCPRIENIIDEVFKEREERRRKKQETIKNTKHWFKITCPYCKTSFECCENEYGTHCYDYLTRDGKEIVGSLDTQTLECPICNKYFKDPTLKHDEDC